MITFRKSLTGKWAVFGSAESLKVGSVVEVTRADGTIALKRVRSVSRSFEVDGVPHIYGFVGRDICPTCRDAEIALDGGSTTCQVCTLEALGVLA